jgi:hypothetical protein
LGFGVSDVKGYKQVSHTGGLEGMLTQITMIPELNLGIIVLTNQQEGGAFVSITNQIKDSYFGITGTDRVKEYSTMRNSSLAETKHLTDSISTAISNAQKSGAKGLNEKSITGTYKDAWLGDVTITSNNGKLWFQSKRSPRLSGELFFFNANTYVVKWSDRSMDADAYVYFTLDDKGIASGMMMKAISPLTDFSYDFHDLDFHRK